MSNYKQDYRSTPWIREGTTIRTNRVQPETGLPFKRRAVVATVDDAAGDDGHAIRPMHKLEIANLIAAAPDLLAACRSTLGWLEYSIAIETHEEADSAPWVGQLRRAIAMAEEGKP